MIPNSHDQTNSSHVALHLLIGQLNLALQPAAAERNNTLVNEIPPCLLVRTNASRLAMVIRQLIETVNRYCEKTSIHLSAGIFGDVLLLHVRKKQYPGEKRNLAECLLPLQQLAQEFYSNVSVTSQRNNVTTLALSFISHPVAA
ncbi:MAG: HAMP domain-containing histidine kinase [Chitinophagaceae bacterium]|nr:MAG: HAMP domain-containing histidine kinase [Chitinophagaceae bacterium]